MNAGGTAIASMVPSCTPSIMRGTVPSWLVGKIFTSKRPGAFRSSPAFTFSDQTCSAVLGGN